MIPRSRTAAFANKSRTAEKKCRAKSISTISARFLTACRLQPEWALASTGLPCSSLIRTPSGKSFFFRCYGHSRTRTNEICLAFVEAGSEMAKDQGRKTIRRRALGERRRVHDSEALQ